MQQLMGRHRNYFYTGVTLDLSFRKTQLKQFYHMLKENESRIYAALKEDLNKSKQETLTTELGIIYSELDFVLKNLKFWMKPEKVEAPLIHKGTQNYIVREPYGVTLVIAPWNYPLQLSLLPALTALAAGNTVVLKPSELAPNTSRLVKELVSAYFEPALFTVVEGEKSVSEALLKQRFDYIFFTGSTNVGKIVMKQASENLIPITLELGGKSPTIVDKNASIPLSAKRIAWGKFTNAGQTCVAPDYLYVHEKIYKKFIASLKKSIRKLYGKHPIQNKDYVRIINQRHFYRLQQYLTDGTLLSGGEVDKNALKIEPTLLEHISENDQVMQDEIFGPILPIIPFNNLDTVIQKLKRKEKPLALYYFGEDKKNQKKVMQQLSFGGGCINDSLYHLANPHLPFGGVGQSGMGQYHGKFGFETFTHSKSVMKQTTMFDNPFRYPGGNLTHAITKRIMK